MKDYPSTSADLEDYSFPVRRVVNLASSIDLVAPLDLMVDDCPFSMTEYRGRSGQPDHVFGRQEN